MKEFGILLIIFYSVLQILVNEDNRIKVVKIQHRIGDSMTITRDAE